MIHSLSQVRPLLAPRFTSVVIWLCFVSATTAGTAANKDTVVLVELFTSEGCSSCPPADANLKRLKLLAEEKGYPIYTLSYHVDYWDRLGWKDPFSSDKATQRQRAYARAFGQNRVYTPQFVVNGTWEFVGSNRPHTRTAIQAALKTQTATELSVSASVANESGIEVRVDSNAVTEGDLMIIGLVQKAAESHVERGENADRHLEHVHVVRDFRQTPAIASQTVVFDAPKGFSVENFHIVAFQQSQNHRGLLGLATAKILNPNGGESPNEPSDTPNDTDTDGAQDSDGQSI